jgi:OOP family OmpA-OmpF porin
MTARRFIGWCSLAAAVLLAGCSTPATRVVLLPQSDGRPSAVIVESNSGEVTLDKPYQRATVRAGRARPPTLDQTDAARVRAENTTLFDLAPPAPQRYTVYFDAGNTSLMPESQREMTTALMVAVARAGSDIVITGYTDTTGAVVSNDELSQRRAQQVRQMFIDRQFPAARIEAVGRGERELAVPTADEVAEPRNRRVTIEVR